MKHPKIIDCPKCGGKNTFHRTYYSRMMAGYPVMSIIYICTKCFYKEDFYKENEAIENTTKEIQSTVNSLKKVK